MVPTSLALKQHWSSRHLDARLFDHLSPLRNLQLEKVPDSEGAPPPDSAPSFTKVSRIMGLAKALLIATFNLATISLGVPFLTAKPTQSSTTRLGKPCSTTVGTFGNAATRLGPVTASARSLPLAINLSPAGSWRTCTDWFR